MLGRRSFLIVFCMRERLNKGPRKGLNRGPREGPNKRPMEGHNKGTKGRVSSICICLEEARAHIWQFLLCMVVTRNEAMEFAGSQAAMTRGDILMSALRSSFAGSPPPVPDIFPAHYAELLRVIDTKLQNF